MQLRAACGGRQARAAASVLQVQSRQPITIGAHSRGFEHPDFSRAAGRCHGVVQCTIGMEGVLWERCSKLVGDRQSRKICGQLAVQILHEGAAGRPAGEERLVHRRAGQPAPFALCVSANASSLQEVTDREICLEFRAAAAKSFPHWLSAPHAADEVFPQRVF